MTRSDRVMQPVAWALAGSPSLGNNPRSAHYLRCLAFVVIAMAWCTYVAGHPSAGTARTLGWLLEPVGKFGGYYLIAAGLSAMLWSLTRWHPIGWLALMVGCGGWVVVTALGLAFTMFTWNGVGTGVLYSAFVGTAALGYRHR